MKMNALQKEESVGVNTIQAMNMNALQKEEVSGFLSMTHSIWMEILAVIGLLAVLRSIYSVCTEKSGETYQNVLQEA